MQIDILGASAASLSIIFELINNIPNKGFSSLRIIKNTDHSLNFPFEIKSMEYTLIQSKEINTLNKYLFLGVYRSNTKKIVYDFFSKKYDTTESQFINLIHTKTSIANTVKLGMGIQINPMVTIAPYAKIGDFVSINRNSSIGHHTTIEKFCTLNPNVHIAGHCHVEENVTLGMGSLVLDSKKIGKNSIVAAGTLVTKDVPENVLVMGSPAKIIKEL